MTTDPTDAETEAMAEKLWNVWRADSPLWKNTSWSELQTFCGAMRSSTHRQERAFRAMARVALGARHD